MGDEPTKRGRHQGDERHRPEGATQDALQRVLALGERTGEHHRAIGVLDGQHAVVLAIDLGLVPGVRQWIARGGDRQVGVGDRKRARLGLDDDGASGVDALEQHLLEAPRAGLAGVVGALVAVVIGVAHLRLLGEALGGVLE